MKNPKKQSLNDEAVPCYVLGFTVEESTAIDSMLSDEGYETGSAGLKKWIIDCAMDEDDSREDEDYQPTKADLIVDRLRAFIEQNPEQAANLMSMAEQGAMGVFGAIKNRFAKKR